MAVDLRLGGTRESQLHQSVFRAVATDGRDFKYPQTWGSGPCHLRGSLRARLCTRYVASRTIIPSVDTTMAPRGKETLHAWVHILGLLSFLVMKHYADYA